MEGDQWLFNRPKAARPEINPLFALLGTANWMRALAILVEDEERNGPSLDDLHADVQRRHPVNRRVDYNTCVFAFMSFQYLSSLRVMADANQPADLIRDAIVGWYYGIYYAASAVIAAVDGSVQEDHRGTDRAWDRQVIQNGYMPRPFAWRPATLVWTEYESTIDA